MEGFTLENVLQAVQSMYGSPSVQPNYKEIDTWLKNYQKSFVAWNIIEIIFATPNLPEYVYIFNAQTLKTKLMYDFEELKSVDQSLFKNNFLNLCLKFAGQDKVMRQLAQSIGILAIHLVEIWGNSMLNEISKVFAGEINLLLEILKSIAEEINNQTIVVDSDKVNQLKLILEQQATSIIKFLESCSNEHFSLILDVFLAWVQIGLNTDIAALLHQSRLVTLTFEAVKIPEKFETACDILCEIISLTENYEKYSGTVQRILQFLNGLKEEATKVRDDETLIEGYIKLFVTFGNTHLNKIINEKSADILEFIADLLLSKSADGVYRLTRFWHRFCRVIKRKPDHEKNDLSSITAYLMQRLFPMCLKQFQLNYEELTTHIEKDTEEIRYNISVLVQDIAEVLTHGYIINLLYIHLSQILTQQNVSDYDKFSQIEAISACIISISDFVQESPQLLSIYLLLSQQIWPISQVNTTICKVFTENNTVLPESAVAQIINYLINCLKNGISPIDVAGSIKKMCSVNYSHLLTQVPSLLELHNISLALSEEAQELILEGISTVLWKAPVETKAIFELCSIYAKNLVTDLSEKELLFNCDKIAVIFRNAIEKDINIMSVYNLFKEIWPEIKNLVNKYENSDKAVEEICRIVKQAIKKLQLAFGEFLADFISIISNQFVRYKHSSYLYMAEQLIKIFGNSQIYEDMMIELFNTLSGSALTALNSYENMENNPELTEDFFGMVTRYLRYFSERTLKSPHFENILVLAKIGIGLQQTEAAKCIYGYLECTFGFCNKESPNFHEFAFQNFLRHFQDILINLINAIVSVVSGMIYELIEEICYKILTIDEGPAWLAIALSNVPYDCLTETEKIKFVQHSQSAQNIHTWLETLYKRAKRRAMRLR